MAPARPSDSPIPIIFLKTPTIPTDPYTDLFSRAHASSNSTYIPQHVPILRHTHILESISDILNPSILENAGLIFTSQRAVSAFGEACNRITSEVQVGVLATLSLPLYVVGPATAASLRIIQEKRLPRCWVLGEDTGTGEVLADLILENHYAQMSAHGNHGEGGEIKMVFLTGEKHRDVIPEKLKAAGINVQEVIVYKTEPRLTLAEDLITALEDARERHAKYYWVVLFSASAAKEILKCISALDESTGKVTTTWCKDAERRVRVAAIGPTTADVMRCEYGFVVDAVAEKPSPEGVRNAIEKAMIDLSPSWRSD